MIILAMQCHARTSPLQLHPYGELLTSKEVSQCFLSDLIMQNFEFLWSPWVHLVCNYGV